MGSPNGDANPPSTPQRVSSAAASGSDSQTRRPSTLKKRRPSQDTTTIGGVGVNTSAGPGPSPLRREVKKRAPRVVDRSSQIQKMIVKWEVPRKALHSSIGFLAIYLYATHKDTYTLVKGLSTALVVITATDLLRFASRRFERLYERALGFLMRESEKTTWNGVIWYLVGVIFVLATLPRDLATLSIMILSWADTAASVIGRKFGKYTFKLPSPPFARRKSLAGTMGAFFFGGLSAFIFFNFVAPYGSESDHTWLGETSAWIPKAVKTALGAQARLVYSGPKTNFPEYLAIGRGARISTILPQPRSTLPLWKLELICAISACLAEGIDIYGFDDNVIMPVFSGLMIWASLYILG